MSYYFLAQINIHDPEEYQKYIDQAGAIFKKYNGEYLAVDNKAKVLEGQWEYGRVVLIKFLSEEAFKLWYHSEEYQCILKHRLKAAQCDTIGFIGLE